MRKKWIQPVPSNYTKELYSSCCLKKNKKIKDLSQGRHFPFELLPSGRCFRAIKTQTKRLKNILYSKVMTALKTAGTSAFFRGMHCAVNPCRMWKCFCVQYDVSFAFLFRISVRIFVCFFIFAFYVTFYIFIFIFFDIFWSLCRGLHRILSNAVVIHCIVYLQSAWVWPPGN